VHSAIPPFDRLSTDAPGNLTIKQGNIVMANSMDLMTINEVEPIYVTLGSRSSLPAVKRYMAQGKLPCARGRRTKPRAKKSEP